MFFIARTVAAMFTGSCGSYNTTATWSRRDGAMPPILADLARPDYFPLLHAFNIRPAPPAPRPATPGRLGRHRRPGSNNLHRDRTLLRVLFARRLGPGHG